MVLNSITFNNVGPFYGLEKINIDKNITIITGQNDTGKSSILNLLSTALLGSGISEDSVNLDYLHEFAGNWKNEKELWLNASFTITKDKMKVGNTFFGINDNIEIIFPLAPELFGKSPKEYILTREGKKTRNILQGNLTLPRIINLSNWNDFKPIIKTSSADSFEIDILNTAFGLNSKEKLINLSNRNLRREARSGSIKINKIISKLLPPRMGFKFEIDNLNNSDILLNIEDKYSGYTPIHLRGDGIKKLIYLLIQLKKINLNKDHVLILIDEPENSLHPDAQHTLRSFLEKLSAQKNTQIIYTTHSAAMINPFTCHGLRLLKRKVKKDHATTSIINKPYEDNFLPVRTSLGITPTDSLLYASITIIIEGYTEMICLPILLSKLQIENKKGFEDVDHLLSQVRFIDGQGDSFEYWVKLTKSQGCKSIIFVDGDKIRRIKQLKLAEKMPEVPVIHLEENTEFEEIVPPENYFKSLSQFFNATLKINDFEKWFAKSGLAEQMMFSKKIEKWLLAIKPEINYDKARVMKDVLETINVDKIKLDTIAKLVEEIRKLINDVENNV
jgi:predicted ATP-dependent endonuclease of OLD family